MFQLRKEEYSKILPLINNITHSKGIIYSVVEGNTEGKIFVDDLENPKTTFIEWEFSYLIGFDTNEDFNSKLLNYIFNEKIPKSKIKELILFVISGNWNKFKKSLKEKGCINIERKMFTFNYSAYIKNNIEKIEIPDTFDIVKIGKEFVHKYEKHEDIMNSPYRFGFSIVNDIEIVSECTTVAIGSKEAEISVETNEKYRNKGYATEVCKQFINYCIANGIIPCWSCWPFRTESIKLAHKLGFEDNGEIPVIFWSEDM